MSKKAIIALIVALCIVVVALVGVLIIGLTGGFTFAGMIRTGNLQPAQEQSAPSEGVKSVRLELGSMDVEVYATQEQSIRMVQYAAGNLSQDELVTFTNAGGTVTIAQRNLTYWFFNIRPYQVLRLYLPASYANDLSVSTASGNVTLMNGFSLGNVYLHLTSGQCKSDFAVSSKQLTLDVTSGSIRLNTVDTESYQIKSTSGNVNVATLNGTGTVNITSGNVTIGAYSGSGTLHTTSGSIAAVLSSLKGNLSVSTTSGEIRLSAGKDTSFDLLASCVSGSVRGNLPMTVSNSGKAASAHIGTSPQSQLTVQAISGNITIDQVK